MAKTGHLIREAALAAAPVPRGAARRGPHAPQAAPDERTPDESSLTARLAAVGSAVAAVAHDGRNDLQCALVNVFMAAWRSEDRPEVAGLLDRARHALEDLHRRFDEMLSFAAPVRLESRECDLAEVWRSAWAKAVAPHAGRDAALEEDLGGTAPTCGGDPYRLSSVFGNLFSNALDACPDPVRVAVVCRRTRLEGRPAVRVLVRDNGPGFTPEQRQRALEPFFTTKRKGAGLGLAIARRIVEAHGGVLAVEESEGPGATLSLTLPRTRAAEAPAVTGERARHAGC